MRKCVIEHPEKCQRCWPIRSRDQTNLVKKKQNGGLRPNETENEKFYTQFLTYIHL